LHYIRCHSHTAGIKFYADPKQSPLHDKLKEIGAEWACEHDIITVSDSSFQDCPDTGRSTGGYMCMIQGGVVDAATVVPTIIAHSTGEAEYNTGALAVMATAYKRKIWNELLGKPVDRMLTVAFGVDSKAATDMAKSRKETKKTRHVTRRMHYFRDCVANGSIKLFYIPGEENWANGLTKPEAAQQMYKETQVYHVNVPS
jgi:hypothetical protein